MAKVVLAGAALGDFIGVAQITFVNKKGSKLHYGYFNESKVSICES